MTAMIAVLSMAAAAGAHQSHEGVERLSGDDTVAAALAWSQWDRADASTEHGIIGRSDDFGDSLASATLQGVYDAPLLLTPKEVLDPRVAQELQRLGVATVHILGGTAAISEQVELMLTAQGYTVQRYSGANRVDTAAKVATAVYDPQRTFNQGEAVLARAFGDGSAGFADALGAGALTVRYGYFPLLITPSDSLAAEVTAYLEEAAAHTVYLAGGTGALSSAVESQLQAMGIEPVRMAGPDRASTAIRVNEERGVTPEGTVSVVLVEGYTDDAWAAGLAASGPANAHNARSAPDDGSRDDPPMPGMPAPQWSALLLSQGDALPAATSDYLDQASGTAVSLVCGPGVATAACDAAAAILELS